MCGRFTLHSRLNLLLQQFALEAGPEVVPRFNIAPTQLSPIIRIDPATGEKVMERRRWGLVPSWAKDPKIGSRMINARGESVASKPAFRTAFKRRRCLVPANGYYEWQAMPDRKQPYYLHLSDQRPFAMAGLFESWKPQAEHGLETFTIITTEANADTNRIHDRMPAILSEDDYDLWLDPEFDGQQALEVMLKPWVGGELQLTPVSRRVNNPRNDDRTCIQAAEADEADPTTPLFG